MRLKCVVAVTLLLAAALSFGQEITGDIRGTVHDPSGAVVSGATVQVVNTDRNIVVRKVVTGSDGAYNATVLPIGHYEVKVDAPGFSPYTATGIVLNVNDHKTYDVTLKVGSQSQAVTVTESPVEVNLQNNTASGLINGTQIRELSVLSRTFIQLVTLNPGVASDLSTDQFYVGASNPTGTSNQINIIVNGGRPSQQSWKIDGSEDLNRGSNLTLFAYPSIDSIAEFKVLRANFLPEHGRASSGEVSVVTRGGTNQFHGSAYEFFRNDKLNANNYFNNLNKIKRPPMRWNDWGFTIGGPIKKDNTFFFYSQEWRHFITYTTFTTGQLPTGAEMTGTFPVPVCIAYDASNNCTATGTTVPSIDPTAGAYIKDIYSKLPTNLNPATGTLTTAQRNLYYYREEAVRLDHNFGQRVSIFGRYSDDSIPTTEPGGLYTASALPGVAITQSNNPAHVFAAHLTATITPTLINDGGYNYSWGGITSNPIGLAAQVNSPDIKPTLPFATSSVVVPLLSFQNGQGVSGQGGYRDYDKDQTIFDMVSKSWGNHSLKFGATFNFYSHNENSNNYPSFTISQGCPVTATTNCAANNTFAQAWANFLLGRAYGFSEPQTPVLYKFTEKEFEAFAQDEWRLRPNLTIDYGVRWTKLNAPLSTNGLASTFDPALYNAAAAPAINPATGRYFAAVDPRTLPGYIQSGKNSPWGLALSPNQMAWAPRFGFAWDPWGDGMTSVRGGFGLFYGSNSIDNQLYSQTSNPGVSPANASYSNTSLSAPVGPAGGGTTTTITPPYIYGPNPKMWKIPYTESFDLDVQHQFTKTVMLDSGYYGNLGRHLMGGVDINMPKPLAFQTIPGYCAGYGGPECYFHAGDWRLLNYVRPYPGFDAINEWTSAFTSSYNGLQAQFQKQFTSNSQMVVNYTWSHNLTDASENFRGAENTYNLKRDWGNSVFDQRHVLTASYVYFLPFHKNQEGFVGHVLGGWELSGIFDITSGKHYDFSTVSCNEDYVGLGTCGNTWAGDPPDQIADPNVGAPNTITQWFNPLAFAYTGCTAAKLKCTAADQGGTPPLRQGNAPRGSIDMPNVFRWDASFFKNTKITERINTQFRAEFFNITNHTNFGQGFPVAGLSASLNSSSYDRILNARDARQIQFALKIIF
ncbi:MAG: carboxypeptidase regulatory-like domain-containing protein [Terriglobales bacterium]